jgi:hypothetical protein
VDESCFGTHYFFVTTSGDASPTTVGHAKCQYFYVSISKEMSNYYLKLA